jgi:restriction endonuclease S subunit
MAEVSEITYSQLKRRLDAEYYKPEHLKIDKKLDHIKNKDIMKNLFYIKDGDHAERAREFVKIGKRYLRAQDLKDGFINDADAVFVSNKVFESLKRSHIRPLDILFSIMGTTDKISIYPEYLPIVTANRAIAILRVKNIKLLNPYFVFAFFRSKYGFSQIIRNLKGGVQQRINLEDFYNVVIPIPAESFQTKIEKIVKEAYTKRKLADELCKRAEKLLLKEFGIGKLELAEDRPSKIRFSEVKKYKRLDAEHYKPEYKRIIEILKESDFELQPLKNVINISKKTIDPTKRPDKVLTYIELANVNPSTGEIEDYKEVIGHKAPSRARMLLKSGDVLVPSLSGSLDNVALVPEELDGSVGSTGFFVISSNPFYSEFLFLLFKSDLIKKQLEQKTAGTIMTAVSHKDFKNILVPIILKEKQIAIVNFIKDSFKLRKEGKELIQKAKQEVEQLIEREAKR